MIAETTDLTQRLADSIELEQSIRPLPPDARQAVRRIARRGQPVEVPVVDRIIDAVADWLLSDSPEACLRLCELRRSCLTPEGPAGLLAAELPDIAGRLFRSPDPFAAECFELMMRLTPWYYVARRLDERFTAEDEERMLILEREEIEDRISTIEREEREGAES